MIRSTCFGHHYAHHQEIEAIQMFTACGTVEQHPSTQMHNLQPRTRPATSHNPGYVQHAVNICIVWSSWWWA